MKPFWTPTVIKFLHQDIKQEVPTLLVLEDLRMFDISREQIEYLSSLGFKWVEIAALLGVSRMTIYRLNW